MLTMIGLIHLAIVDLECSLQDPFCRTKRESVFHVEVVDLKWTLTALTMSKQWKAISLGCMG